MSSHDGHSIIHKSYQVLFVIYAPIALISIALKIFSPKHISYIYSMAFIAAVVSVILAIVMWVQFFKHRKRIQSALSLKLPYLISHQFILLYLPIAFLSIGISVYYFYSKSLEQAHNQEQIVLLLPLTNNLNEPSPLSEQYQLALGSYLVRQPTIASRYQFQIADHKSTYNEELLNAVIDKANTGTKYFICAESDTCSQLIQAVETQTKRVLHSKPIFITTLASANNLPLSSNTSYRLFPRASEITQSLAGYATRQNKLTASYVIPNDLYGTSMMTEFSRAWQNLGGTMVDGITINTITAEDVAMRSVDSHFTTNGYPDAVFVATEQRMIESLAKLAEHTMLLMAPTYQIENIERLLHQVSNKENIVLALPEYKLNRAELLDTHALFLYLTLNKVITIDQALKTKEDKSFDDLWWTEGNPAFLPVERDGSDMRIPITAEPFVESVYRDL